MAHPGSTATPHPFSSPGRIALVLTAWVAVSCVQGIAILGSNLAVGRAFAVLAYYAAIGLAWGLLALAIGGMIVALERRRAATTPRVVAYMAALITCAIVDTMARRIGGALLGGESVLPWYGTMLYFADFTLVSYAAAVLLARSLTFHDRFVVRQRRSLALEAQVTRARLASLEEQLHPHFLFNSLGAVIELAHEAPAVASRLLRQLASIVRFAVEREGPEVSVAAEFATLEPYLDVHRTRFADWLTVDTSVASDAAGLMVPPLVIQPLVENAIRHGLTRRDAPGHIRIAATVRDGMLTIIVHDNGVGLRAADSPGRGIGLSNLRERLSALYEGAAELSVHDDEQGGTVSQVTIPARHASTEPIPLDDSNDAGVELPLLPAWIRRRPAVAIVLGWVVWGLLYTQQSIAYLAFRDRLAGRSLLGIAGHDFATALIWAAFTPIMLIALQAIPIRPPRLILRVVAHAVVAIAIAISQGYLTHVIFGDSFAPLSSSGLAAIVWGMLAYAVVIGVGYHREIGNWMRERELADSRLRLRMAEARLHDNTSRTHPRQLVDRLEAIAESIGDDAAAAERALVQLSDQLRQTLTVGAAA
jgi:two-component system LytT family sensor kinase